MVPPWSPLAARGASTTVGASRGTVFELDTRRGKLRIDARMDLAISGPPLVIIPRDVDRERRMLASWGLGLSLEPTIHEVIIEPGATIDVGGVHRDGALEEPAIKTRR
jgi:hypothetical protein